MLLEYLFSYLYRDETYDQLNQTLAGYFSKTVTAIINVKGLEFIDYVFTEKMDCFEKMISKIGCRSLADLFSKFLAMYNPEKDEIKENYIE